MAARNLGIPPLTASELPRNNNFGYYAEQTPGYYLRALEKQNDKARDLVMVDHFDARYTPQEILGNVNLASAVNKNLRLYNRPHHIDWEPQLREIERMIDQNIQNG